MLRNPWRFASSWSTRQVAIRSIATAVTTKSAPGSASSRSVVQRTVTSQSAASLRRSVRAVMRASGSRATSTSQSSAPRSSGTRKTSRRSSMPKMTLPMPIATTFMPTSVTEPNGGRK
jgi:hypothetical protein